MGGAVFGVPVAEWVGVLIAFLTTSGMIYLDCHQVLSGVIRYVPDAFFRSSQVLALAAAGGAVAGALYLVTTPSGHDAVSGQIGVTQANAFLRAFTVGVVALALIRSKFFKLPQGDFGGDYIYIQLRQGVLGPIIVDWNRLKTRFVQANLAACLATPNFISDTLATVSQTVAAFQGEDAAPAVAFSPAAPEWELYYRTVIRLALDDCGPSIFQDAAFTWPK